MIQISRQLFPNAAPSVAQAIDVASLLESYIIQSFPDHTSRQSALDRLKECIFHLTLIQQQSGGNDLLSSVRNALGPIAAAPQSVPRAAFSDINVGIPIRPAVPEATQARPNAVEYPIVNPNLKCSICDGIFASHATDNNAPPDPRGMLPKTLCDGSKVIC